MKTLPQPWTVAMEATIFTGWIYDHLLPHAQRVKVAHPLIRAPSQPPRRRTIRLMPARSPTACAVTSCRSASTQIRDRRRTLRYRHLLVRQMVQMKNRISGLLMETGVSYNKQRLHRVGYFPATISVARTRPTGR
ncbi:MAG: hypothetical protein WB660_18320 [Candidatus Sulfotelmatobacter sp.]